MEGNGSGEAAAGIAPGHVTPVSLKNEICGSHLKEQGDDKTDCLVQSSSSVHRPVLCLRIHPFRGESGEKATGNMQKKKKKKGLPHARGCRVCLHKSSLS